MSANFEIEIENPFLNKKDYNNKILFYKSGLVSEHKAVEVQFNGFDPKYFVSCAFRWTDKTYDHHGLRLHFALVGFYLEISFYDIRHADDDWKQ